MTETYRSLGQGASLGIAFIGAVMLVGYLIALRLKKAKPRTAALSIGLGAWYLVSGLLALPTLIVFSVTFLIMPVSIFTQTPRVNLTGRIASIVMVIVLSAAMFAVMPEQKIILGDKTITALPTGIAPASEYEDGTMPREGLKVRATTFEDLKWMQFRQWHNWSLERGDDRLNIDVSGNDYYWGPHGLETGEQVGERIAKWSGVTATYTVHRHSHA